MKYVIYARVSTEEQDLRTQIEECKSYCGKNKFVIFEDEGTRGDTPFDKKHVLLAAISECKKGDVFLFHRLDRVMRDQWQLGVIKYFVEKQKASIACVKDNNLNSDDPYAQAMVGMMAVFATLEKVLIRARTKEKLQAIRKRGHRSGEVPYGYSAGVGKRDKDGQMVEPAKLRINADEVENINLMIELLDRGMSFRDIAYELECRGVRNRNGKPFVHSAIFNIIKNRPRNLETIPVN